MSSTILFLYLFIFFVLLDMLVMAAKNALDAVRFTRLLALQDQENVDVSATMTFLNRSPQLQASLHVSQTILRFGVGVLALLLILPAGVSNIPLTAIAIDLLIVALVLAFLENMINGFVRRDPETWAIRFTTFTRGFLVVFSPLYALPLALYRWMFPEPERSYTVTEEELKMLLDSGKEKGMLIGIEEDEREMLTSIFEFHDTIAREIMVPRIDMYTLSVDTSIRDAIDAVLSSGYSRIPAYKETTDTIAGFIYVKDLLRVCCEGNMDTTIESHLRPPYFVPESKMVDDLLTELQDKKIHLAIVVDEYGGVAGLVTLEDIMEEIVGEIQDETDKKEEELFESISKDEFVFRGRIEVEDVNELMKIDLSNDEVDTLGGYIYSKIGRVPKVGESVAADDILFTVMQVTGRRIRKVRAQRSLTKEKGNPADA